jgi:hypothetical protein
VSVFFAEERYSVDMHPVRNVRRSLHIQISGHSASLLMAAVGDELHF